MHAHARALLSVTALAASALAAWPAEASQALECAPAGSGALSCWDGKLTLRSADLVAPNLAAAAPWARYVSVAHDRACASTPDGALHCWGDNDSGELGDGTRTHRDTPVRVRGLDDAAAVALGNSLSCALRRTGEVACWGYDDVTRTRRLRPSTVPSLDHVVELAAGGEHACARRQDGSVRCWGNNHYGQLGDGTQKSRRLPVQVVGLTDVVELAAGSTHTCARRRDGSVWCWGNGWAGEDGTEDRLLVPSRVTAIREATALVTTQLGFVASQSDGRFVSCRYAVGPAESEASPRLACETRKAPAPGAFKDTPIALRRR